MASSIFQQQDIDGHWWKFNQQQRNCSCGPACVKIVKDYTYNKEIGEDAIRGLLGLIIRGQLHTGVTLSDAEVDTCSIWENQGTWPNIVLKALQSEPHSIRNARPGLGVEDLRYCSRNHPAILGVRWANGGGHFVACVGPTKQNTDLFIILDPWYGIHYLSANDSVGNALFYTTPDGAKGQIDSVGYIVTHPA